MKDTLISAVLALAFLILGLSGLYVLYQTYGTPYIPSPVSIEH